MRARLLWLLLVFMPAAAAADESPVGMSWVTTPDLRLFYYDSLGYLTPHTIRTFTNALAWQRRMFHWTPSEATIVMLQDLGDYGNALTYAAPKNTLVFDVSPLSHAFETFPASERIYTLMNHELVHVAQADVATEEDRKWRRFFLGKVSPYSQFPETLLYSYLTIPRFTVPRWLAEGQAVFVETFMGGGLGRAQGGYDEMVFRAMVRDGAHFYDPLGLVSRGVQIDFQVGANAYLYGTRFFTWLAYSYSPEKALEWIRRDEGSRRYYSDQFEHVFGLPLERAWQDWIAFEREFQARNLAAVRKFPITPHRDLVARPLGNVSRTYYDEATGILYGAFRYPGVVEHVGALDTRTGTVRQLADIKRAMLYRVASFADDPSTGTAFWTNDNPKYRDLMAVDVKTGEQRMLLEDVRIGEIVVNPADRTLYGVRHANGFAQLVRIPPPYNLWYEIVTLPYGVVPYDLDISPDGRLLSASVAEVNGDQFLRVWDLSKVLAGDLRPRGEFRFGQSVPESFTFSRDGRYLYGSSYYTGVSNIFRYDISTGAMDAVSNAETGFFRPVPLADGRLVVLNYTAEGFVPAIIEPKPLADVSAITFLGSEVVKKYPELMDWQVAPPGSVDDEKLITGKGAYHPAKSLSLVNGFPTLQGYKNAIGIGYHLNFLDPVQYTGLGITAAWTPKGDMSSDEQGHFDLSGRYLNWWGELAWNKSDFYDMFGPTKRSRKGVAAKVGYDQHLIFDEPRFLTASYELDWFDKIDTLPNAQNVGTPFTRLLTAKVALVYSDYRRSLGAVDDEKGIGWSIAVKGNRVRDETPATQLYGTFDYGFALPIPHSSLWLRTAAGVSSGDRDNPVANYYFGGFGNNYVDAGAIKRYRDIGSMPGFEIDEISGQRFVRQMVEWNLPPIVFESAGTPALYLNWLRPAVFASALWTDPSKASLRNDYQSLGAQADLRFSVLHRYEMTLSIGYAVGFRGAKRAGDELMVSLKIL
jgi:hypothetical protein